MTAQTPTTEQVRQGWEGIAVGFDEHVTPQSIGFAEDVLARVRLGPGVRFLDVAAGTGALSIPAARRGAQVVAVDLAPIMVERLEARARAEGLSNLEASVMDGTALDLPDASFDVVASLNGISLFPDLEAGLRELVRVLEPGGRGLIAAFGSPRKAEFLGWFLGALQAAVPDFAPPPMDPPPLPFQVADPEVLRQRMTDAGLGEVTVEPVTWHMPFRSADHFWHLVTSSNPIGAALVAELTAEQRDDVRRVLDGMLRERSGGRPGATLTAEMNIALGTR